MNALGSILPVVVGTTALAVAGAEPGGADAVFPFAKGHYWLYDGTVSYVEGGAVREQAIKGWKSEVTDVVVTRELRAALLKGHPADLAWYERGKERGHWLVILTAKGDFLEIGRNDHPVEKFAAIRAAGKLPEDIEVATSTVFRFPAKADDRFGDPQQVKLGPRYCWVVLDASTRPLDPPVKGVASTKEFPTLTLTYRTTPDHTNLCFAAGVGITSYEYVHHGTKGDCAMQLVATGAGKP